MTCLGPTRRDHPVRGSGTIDNGVASYHYWTLFWAYPHANVFWTAVAVAAVTSLGLHVARVRRISSGTLSEGG